MSDEPNPPFEFPANDEHTTIVGRNGCGKTQLGCYLLAKRDLRNKRWIALDFKGDELLNSLDNARYIDDNKIPKAPGLYIKQYRRESEDVINEFLWNIWDKEDTGVYVDEGYFVPQGEDGAFKGLLTTGRSKRIPVITLSQRPVRVSRYAFSEVSHIAVFDLNDRRDWRTLDEVLPQGFTDWLPDQFKSQGRLPKFHARWYSVKKNGKYIVTPVPSADEIRELINDQLEPRRRWL